jgi:hypothetical protein
MKYGPSQKTYIWMLRGYDANNIDSRGNPKKGAKKPIGGGGRGKKSHVQCW